MRRYGAVVAALVFLTRYINMNEELAKIASNIDHADDCGNINAIEELLKKCNGLLESETFSDRAIVYFLLQIVSMHLIE